MQPHYLHWKGSYPGGAPGLQNRRGALNVPGGFDSHPFPPLLLAASCAAEGGVPVPCRLLMEMTADD